MALRILSGIIVLDQDDPAITGGSIRIDLDAHEKLSGDGRIVETSEAGASGPFQEVPCKHVALRQFFSNAGGPTTQFGPWVEINDGINPDVLRVSWECLLHQTSRNLEISYMLIGEV